MAEEKKYPYFKMVPISKLKRCPYNPRVINSQAKASLEKSITEFGMLDAVVYNAATKYILSGHQRLEILEKQGYTEVMTCVVNVEDPIKEKALVLQMNNPYAQGTFTNAAQDIIEEIRDCNPGLYDSLLFRPVSEGLLEQINEEAKNADAAVTRETNGIQGTATQMERMELLPYESYDHILVVFDDTRDFASAINMLGLKKMDCSPLRSRKKIGLARCISGKVLLEAIGRAEDDHKD